MSGRERSRAQETGQGSRRGNGAVVKSHADERSYLSAAERGAVQYCGRRWAALRRAPGSTATLHAPQQLTLPSLPSGVLRYQKPRYMLVPQLIEQLLAASAAHLASGSTTLPGGGAVLDADRTLAVALCRMGTDEEGIYSGTLGELLALARASPEEAARDEAEDDADEMASETELEARRAARAEERAKKAFGGPLHSLVLVGARIHGLEAKYAGMFQVAGSRWDAVARDVYGCRE